jgi:hypothetical protein
MKRMVLLTSFSLSPRNFYEAFIQAQVVPNAILPLDGLGSARALVVFEGHLDPLVDLREG